MTFPTFRHLPRELRDVASLNLFVGGAAILSDILEAARGNFDFPLGGILSLVLGVGLLRLNPLARRVQIILLYLTFAGLVVIALMWLFVALSGRAPIPLMPIWKLFAGGAAIALAVSLSVWELRVLSRPEIQKLFGADTLPVFSAGRNAASLDASLSLRRVPRPPPAA